MWMTQSLSDQVPRALALFESLHPEELDIKPNSIGLSSSNLPISVVYRSGQHDFTILERQHGHVGHSTDRYTPREVILYICRYSR